MRNPLYHWTHMELRRPFGVTDAAVAGHRAGGLRPLQRAPAGGRLHGAGPAARLPRGRRLHDRRSDRLARRAPAAGGARRDPDTRVYPTWRPDKAFAVEDAAAFNAWVDRLEEASGVAIGGSLDRFLDALEARARRLPRDGVPRVGPRARDDVRRAVDGRRGRRLVRPRARRASRSTPAARSASSRRSSTTWPCSTTRAAGCSSSTWARCATTTRGCAGRSGPTPGSTPSATSRWRARSRGSSTAWTRPTSSPRRSSTT